MAVVARDIPRGRVAARALGLDKYLVVTPRTAGQATRGYVLAGVVIDAPMLTHPDLTGILRVLVPSTLTSRGVE